MKLFTHYTIFLFFYSSGYSFHIYNIPRFPIDPILIVVFLPPSRNDGIEKSCMLRTYRKERRQLTQKSCRKEQGVQRRPAIHRFVFFLLFFVFSLGFVIPPNSNSRSSSPSRFSFLCWCFLSSCIHPLDAPSSEWALHLGMALCDLVFARAATGRG
ncbi:hypothetical protein GGI42DRAFT_314095 [Trichoderma sp. SZMC 28013]